tara:strand:+ start:769 stop:1227 length:459 start_codon:yes stop_codon:yes gene_type:complete
MVIDRDYASNHELGFAQNPELLTEHSHVNMYLHHDGYPEWQGVQLANWLLANQQIVDGSRLAAKMVHDMYYNSCYLYPGPEVIDHNYTYVVWTGDSDDMWISCYDQYHNANVFVLTPDKVLARYSNQKYDYTDWVTQTRSEQEKEYAKNYTS